MLNWRALASALEQPVAKLEKMQKPSKSRDPLMLVAVALLAPVYLFLLVQGYQSFLEAWQYNSWQFYGSGLWVVFIVVIFARLAELRERLTSSQKERAPLLLAVQAAIAGDDALAPPEIPPDTLEDPAISDEQLELHVPEDGMQITFGLALLLVGGLFALFAAIYAVTAQQKQGTLLDAAIVCGMGVLLFIAGLVLLKLARKVRVVCIQIDSAGVSWRHERSQGHAGWHELRAFITVHHQGTFFSRAPYDVFLLDTASAVVAWELTDGSSEAERSVHRYLCHQIVTHTSLRLRDLTESFEKSIREAQAAGASARTIMGTTPATSPLTVPGAMPEPVNPHLATSRPPRKLPRVTVGLLLVSLPAILLYPLGWGAQRYEAHYYAVLVERVQVEQPLYQDSFLAPDGQWCLQTPTAKDSEFYEYRNSSLEMGGGTSTATMKCQGSSSYANFAVEATTRQPGSDPYNDGIGLELRVSQDRGEVFIIDQEGYWLLWDYLNVRSNADLNRTAVDQGYSSAIHQGSGATNRLLVIAHGDQFIFYINSAFVAVDAVRDAQRTGDIGLFSYDAALTSAFTNFTVYPLPSLAPALPWGS